MLLKYRLLSWEGSTFFPLNSSLSKSCLARWKSLMTVTVMGPRVRLARAWLVIWGSSTQSVTPTDSRNRHEVILGRKFSKPLYYST